MTEESQTSTQKSMPHWSCVYYYHNILPSPPPQFSSDKCTYCKSLWIKGLLNALNVDANVNLTEHTSVRPCSEYRDSNSAERNAAVLSIYKR